MRKKPTLIEKTFINAKTNSGIQYCFTLLRAEGWVSYQEDPIDAVYKRIKTIDVNKVPIEQQEELLKSLLGEMDLYKLILNILNNGQGKSYSIRPFKTYKQDLSHFRELVESIDNYNDPPVRKYLKNIFEGKIEPFYDDIHSSAISDAAIKEINKRLASFLKEFLETYKKVLMGFKSGENVHKLPYIFVTVELLTDDSGLCGVKFHAPGIYSLFIRKSNGTQQQCYSFNQDGEIVLYIGGGDPLWVYNDKPLYERGLKGRYNQIGEWKPIVYPQSSEMVSAEAHKRTKDELDKRIEACMFYCLTTCYHAIEFVVKTNIDLPFEYTTAKSNKIGVLHFHKVKLDIPSNSVSNIVVYDGTLELVNIENETIKNGLGLIETFLHKMSFRVDGKVEWFLKYPLYSDASGKIAINKKGFSSIGKYMTVDLGSDSSRIDTSISWFINGNISTNPFTKFLSYYIAFESLAIPFVDGKLEISTKYKIKPLPKSARNKQINECIRVLHEELYPSKPQEFVSKSYACIGSLNSKTKVALEKVFGKESTEVIDFFKKVDGYSFYLLRNKLAHGDFSHIEENDRRPIQERLGALKDIVFRFILALSSPKNDRSKTYFSHTLSMQTSDPRSSSVVSSLDFIPNKDWRIKLEWLL